MFKALLLASSVLAATPAWAADTATAEGTQEPATITDPQERQQVIQEIHNHIEGNAMAQCNRQEFIQEQRWCPQVYLRMERMRDQILRQMSIWLIKNELRND